MVYGWLGFLTIIFLVTPAGLSAQTTSDSVKIEPTFQELVIKDTDASVAGQLTLTNQSQVDQTFEIFAIDVKQFDSSGRVVLADKPLSGTDVTIAGFVTIPTARWSIPANQKQSVPFWVSNAPRLSPGGHYAALVARLVPSDTVQQEVLPALSSFVLVRKIGGELYHLSLKPLESARQTVWWSLPKKLQLTFSNQGNIHVTPYGTVDFIDVFGHTTHRGIINESSLFVFPGSERSIETIIKPITASWPIMVYKLVISAYSQPGNVPANTTSTIIIIQPVSAILVAGGVLALICIKLYRSKRKSK